MYGCNTRDAILCALSNVMYNTLFSTILFDVLTRIVFFDLCPIIYLI